MENRDLPLMVTIQCITYNHEPYIRQCLEGFVMQKADFRFEAIVHDDASTDGTAAIIREYAAKYPDIIKPIFETENQYSKHDGSLQRIMSEHTHGKYVAICEGDDYWTDPLKLQKQVDFLESHPEYGLCYTNVQQYYDISGQYGECWGGNREAFEDLLFSNTIPALSVLVRSFMLQEYFSQINSEFMKWKMGDYPMWLYVATKAKIKYMPFTSGCYRILENSASHSRNPIRQLEFEKSSIEIAVYFIKKENVNVELLRLFNLKLGLINIQISVLRNDIISIQENRRKILNNMRLIFPFKQNLKAILLILFPKRMTSYLLAKR